MSPVGLEPGHADAEARTLTIRPWHPPKIQGGAEMLAGHGGLISDSGLIRGFGSRAWDFNDNISIQEFKVENDASRAHLCAEIWPITNNFNSS